MNIADLKQNNKEQIGEQLYTFDFVLFNNENQMLPLHFSAVKSLDLYDDILKWYHYGSAELNNSFSVLDKANNVKDKRGNIVNNCWSFRNDDQLYLYLNIEPHLDPSFNKSRTLESETFSMEFMFKVTKVEDIDQGTEEERIKRIEFIDYRYEIMKNTLSEYSTVPLYESIVPVNERNPDEIGDVYTGDAVKDILSNALGTVNFTKRFDKGKYITSYTSPHKESYLYDLETMLGRHICSDSAGECPALLKSNRFVENGNFSLIPLYDLFKNAYDSKSRSSGIFHNEKFTLSNQSTQGSPFGDGPPPTSVDFNDTSAFHFPDHSVISTYELQDIQPEFNSAAIKPVEMHNYDFENKEFRVSNISMTNIDDEYVNNLTKPVLGSDERTYNTSGSKYTNKDRLVEFSSSSNHKKSKAYAKNKMINKLLYNGRKLTFECKGITLRRSMRFISVEHPNRGKDSDFDKKILGQYLVLGVSHSFTPEGYTNLINAVTTNNAKSTNQENGSITNG